MKVVILIIALMTCAVAVAGCGGGGSHALPAAGGGNATTTSVANAPFAITVTSASAVTKIGISSSAETGSPEHDVAIVAGANGCSAVTGGLLCNVNVSLPSGAQVLTVKTYGTKTAQSTLRATVGTSRIALAVGTSVAQVSLDLAATSLAGSGSGTTTLYVTARDANGNTIVGDLGGTTIALASSDTTGSVTLSSTSVTSGSSAVTVSYNGSGDVGTVTFSATVAGLAASAFTTATLSFTASQVMYLGDATSLLVFPAGATGDPVPLQRIVFSPPANTIGDVGVDSTGNLWVNLFLSAVYIFPATSSGVVSSPKTLPSSSLPAGQVPADVGADAAGDIYVLSETLSGGPAAISIFTNGSTTPSRVITGSATTLGTQPIDGLGVAADGTMAVMTTDPTATYGAVLVFAPTATGNATPSEIITGSATTLSANGVEYGSTAVAFGPDKSVIVNDVSATAVGAIDVFAPVNGQVANGNVAPTRRITGSLTGLDASQTFNYTTFTPVTGTGKIYTQDGLGVDGKGRIYVSEIGSQSGVAAQVARFDTTANGNVAPNGLLGGPLTLITSPGYAHFSNAVVAPPPAVAPALSGDFLALSANRGWNYSMQAVPPGFLVTPPPAFTMTLYTDPTPVNGDTQLVALQEAGTEADATAGSVVAAATFNLGSAGYTATSFTSVSTNVGPVPIPGGMLIVPPSLTLGQTFVPYLGITGTVVAIGNVPGSSACPGGAATGATVQYSFGNVFETISYVPGCGITSFISDAGTVATLTSVGSYPALGQLAHTRVAASADRLNALHALWRTVFTPWSAK